MNPHAGLDLPLAPQWALALGSLGRAAVLAAVVGFLLSAVGWGLSNRAPKLERAGRLAFWVGALGLVTAFVSVLTLFVQDQFVFTYVFNHGAKDHELQYKVAGVWSGQEGSFLLWALSSALFGLLAGPRTGPDRRVFTIVYALFLAALAGILAYESPFALQPLFEGRQVSPPDGRGLAPSLLNYWVVIHPPTIFLGFGSLTVLFAWAFAALWRRDLDGWIQPVRPWAILATTLVGLGLCMGGFWAYETLGWGGFWMWDPVENTSFVPWVAAAALIHGAFVQVAKRKWKLGNAMLGALPFLAFCYGTFLTRSGFLADTSVHSFAQMDRSALWILVGLSGLALVSFLVLWTVRLVQAKRSSEPTPPAEPAMSRGGFYAAAIWLLLAMGAATAFGMSVPMVMSLTGQQPKVVEEELYHRILVWLFPPIMLGMSIAPFLGWRKTGFREVLLRLNFSLAISLMLVGWLMYWALSPWGVQPDPAATIQFPLGVKFPLVPWMGLLSWLCLFAMTANAWRFADQFRKTRAGLGGFVTHFGLAMTLLGLVFSRGFERKVDFTVMGEQPANALGYVVLHRETGDITKRTNKVVFDMIQQGGGYTARPGLYYTMGDDGRPNPMVWPHIQFFGTHDIYFTLHPISFEASEPTEFKAGERRVFEDLLITYRGMRTEGRLGRPGAKFIADVTVETPEGKTEPSLVLQMTEAGLEPKPQRVSDDFELSLVRIDAASKNVFLQVSTIKPIFPIELFYKPLTGLVWLGVGIMTLGGAMAAWSRRRAPKPAAAPTKEAEPQPEEKDAPVPTA